MTIIKTISIPEEEFPKYVSNMKRVLAHLNNGRGIRDTKLKESYAFREAIYDFAESIKKNPDKKQNDKEKVLGLIDIFLEDIASSC